ncbi:helix-turn-helix domain-containing protein [Micromonospora chokoriensis]|uniref:Acetyltransferase (GNAT) family protein n=1 Tax=Micromonospora chokoriensis TaxID=356851 RepID=A0A1C4UVJ4_9ACTN|nr:helix-turn-helix transcriptional regulator [Micromonospora chokoriensis]SCE75661.1 Acetyltransferase (GNAT) family protein [Micromonospora chokoriensis]
MTEETEVTDCPDGTGEADLGRALRALRRRADLSQRELAERSGVPQPTLARIESGRAADPRFRTVERLVTAAGGEVAVGVSTAPAVTGPTPVPHDDMRDKAGRRYPAHLDVWPVHEPRDWPGAWWAEWYRLPPQRYPLPLPPAAYELNRRYRDNRRWGDEVRRTAQVRRLVGDLPATCWRYVAELPDGQLVGELRAHERSPHLEHGEWHPGEAEREMVLDGVLVDPRYRRLGLGRRLVTALLTDMRGAGVEDVAALAEGAGIDLLLACGFKIEARRPAALRLGRPGRQSYE